MENGDVGIPTFNVLSLCTGYGGVELGLRRAIRNCRVVACVEHEAYACEVLATRMEAQELDQAPIWSNAVTFDGNPWRGVVDCITGGFPCFGAGTLVLTDKGYLPIESISVGDTVLSHTGEWRKVTSTMARDGAELRMVRGQGITDIITTDDHPFYGRERINRKFGNPRWVYAKDLQGKFASQAVPDEQPEEHSEDFWWIIGRYLADGWMVDRKTRGDGLVKSRKPNGKVVICCNKSECSELEDRISRSGFHFTKVIEGTVAKYHITDTRLYKFVQQFGRHAYGKRIPRIALELDREKSKSLLDGYFSGDGYREESGSNRSFRATTVSESLALGIALLAQRAYGIVASVRKQSVKPTTVIEGRTVNRRTQYIVSVPDRNRSAFVEGKYGWKLVRKSESCGVGRVYNLSVEVDESYIANGAIVHNCQPFSDAGKKRGVEDSRHLWPHIATIVREVQPQWCFFENVPGLLTTRTPDGRYAYQHVSDDLQEMGYRIEAGLFSAEEVGAPHRRLRLFILAHCNSNEWRTNIREPNSKTDWRDNVIGNGGDDVENTEQSGTRTEVGAPRWRNGTSDVRQENGSVGPSGTYTTGGDVVNAKSVVSERGVRERDSGREPEEEIGDTDSAVEYPYSARLQGRRTDGQDADQLLAWPPSPTSTDWERIPEQYWPARPYDVTPRGRKALGHPCTSERDLRGMAHGSTVRVDDTNHLRILRLRLLGNGVVPSVAELAWTTLWTKLTTINI